MKPEFWSKRKVFLTGHTGFKGSWLSLWLQSLGAEVAGYALAPHTQPNLFELARVAGGMNSVQGDILHLDHLRSALQEQKPEVVFHMAAQSLVRRSYNDPVGTYATNVLGTVNVLEALRNTPSVRSIVIVTTDKCYENGGDQQAYRETDRLGGDDPYSSSKAAAELITAAYRKSFFFAAKHAPKVGLASARAGNVIGGGDWSADRLIPDVVRATLEGREVCIRHPHAVRPWQHVLDPLCGYLTLAEKLWTNPEQFSESWNFGPRESGAAPVSAVLEQFKEFWGSEISVRFDDGDHPHEAQYLKLDCAKAIEKLGWEPEWNLKAALEATVRWYKAYQLYQAQSQPKHSSTRSAEQDMRAVTLEQIHTYQSALRVPEISRR